MREGSAAGVHTLGSQLRDIIGRVKVSFGVWTGHEWRETEVSRAVQVLLLSNRAVHTQQCTHRGAHNTAHTTLHTQQCTHRGAHSAVYTQGCTHNTAHSTVYTQWYTLSSAHTGVHTQQRTLTVCTQQCTQHRRTDPRANCLQ